MFEFNGVTITNIFLDESGRFSVNPMEYYNLTKEEVETYRQLKEVTTNE